MKETSGEGEGETTSNVTHHSCPDRRAEINRYFASFGAWFGERKVQRGEASLLSVDSMMEEEGRWNGVTLLPSIESVPGQRSFSTKFASTSQLRSGPPAAPDSATFSHRLCSSILDVFQTGVE